VHFTWHLLRIRFSLLFLVRWDILQIIPVPEFFILYIFVEKLVDLVDRKAAGDFPEGIDAHFEAFQIFVDFWVFFLFWFLGHFLGDFTVRILGLDAQSL
jgi:hypothetical protein